MKVVMDNGWTKVTIDLEAKGSDPVIMIESRGPGGGGGISKAQSFVEGGSGGAGDISKAQSFVRGGSGRGPDDGWGWWSK